MNYLGPAGAIELHRFSDAASRTYATAVYLRCADASSSVTIQLLIAKTRVELCGAVVLAHLLRSTARRLGMENVPVFAWTDAIVALVRWIRPTARWKQFVAHRVAEVQNLVPPPH